MGVTWGAATVLLPLVLAPAGSARYLLPVPSHPVMPLSRLLRSVRVFLLPSPCWVPLERWLGPLRRPSLVSKGSVLGAWHSARCRCQAWTVEPR